MSEEDFDPDGELQTISLDPREAGNSFALRHESYRALALCCLSVASELMTIRKFRDEWPGAIVELYGRDVLLTLSVDGTWDLVALFVHESLDSCATRQLLSEEDSSEEGWQRIRDMMKTILGERET